MESYEKLVKQEITGQKQVQKVELKYPDDLPGLIKHLKGMNDNLFSHYVTKAHNNIADWVFEHYKNEKLSRKVRKLHRKEKIVKLLEKEVKKQGINKSKKDENKKSLFQRIKLPKRKKDILKELESIDSHLNSLTSQ